MSGSCAVFYTDNLQKIKICSLFHNSNFFVLDKKIKNNRIDTIFILGE